MPDPEVSVEKKKAPNAKINDHVEESLKETGALGLVMEAKMQKKAEVEKAKEAEKQKMVEEEATGKQETKGLRRSRGSLRRRRSFCTSVTRALRKCRGRREIEANRIYSTCYVNSRSCY